jgi:hypothetical protein
MPTTLISTFDLNYTAQIQGWLRGAGFEDTYSLPPTPLGIAPKIEIVQTTALVSDANTAKSLATSLAAALDVVTNDDPSDDVAGGSMLNGFINKVGAQRGKEISGQSANELMSAAYALRVEVG